MLFIGNFHSDGRERRSGAPQLGEMIRLGGNDICMGQLCTADLGSEPAFKPRLIRLHGGRGDDPGSAQVLQAP